MRENMGVYRGKRIYNGEWLEGSLLFYPDVNRAFMSLGRFHKIGDFFEIDKKTIGQHTNKDDRHGKKVFEDDILRFENNDGEYSLYVCRWSDKESGWIVDSIGQGGYDTLDAFFCENAEVIGNIHDNPELLEVSEDE